MEAKYTPGEWRAIAGPPEYVAIVTPAEDYGEHIIARLYRNDTQDWRENDANGMLMAAAPKLLAALHGVIHHNDAVKDAYKLPASLVQQVEAAIAKAEGRSV